MASTSHINHNDIADFAKLKPLGRLLKIKHFGDKGYTQFLGIVTPKHSVVIEFIGSLDELNAVLGVIKTLIKEHKEVDRKHSEVYMELDSILQHIQRKIINITYCLTTIPQHRKELCLLQETDIQELEEMIERLWNTLSNERKKCLFVLPRENIVYAFLNLARTVCRRVERIASRLFHYSMIRKECYVYLNRLSDLLYILMRYLADRLDIIEECL